MVLTQNAPGELRIAGAAAQPTASENEGWSFLHVSQGSHEDGDNPEL
jgi:hypothetical protein